MKMNLTTMAAVALAIGNSSAIASTLSPADDGAVAAYESMIGLPDVSNPGEDNRRPDDRMLFPDREFPPTGNHGEGFGRPDHMPSVNPPFDTPAVNEVRNNPVIPVNVPDYTFPGADFGQVVVPVPAAVWLFGSGLLGLIGLGQSRKR